MALNWCDILPDVESDIEAKTLADGDVYEVTFVMDTYEAKETFYLEVGDPNESGGPFGGKTERGTPDLNGELCDMMYDKYGNPTTDEQNGTWTAVYNKTVTLDSVNSTYRTNWATYYDTVNNGDDAIAISDKDVVPTRCNPNPFPWATALDPDDLGGFNELDPLIADNYRRRKCVFTWNGGNPPTSINNEKFMLIHKDVADADLPPWIREARENSGEYVPSDSQEGITMDMLCKLAEEIEADPDALDPDEDESPKFSTLDFISYPDFVKPKPEPTDVPKLYKFTAPTGPSESLENWVAIFLQDTTEVLNWIDVTGDMKSDGIRKMLEDDGAGAGDLYKLQLKNGASTIITRYIEIDDSTPPTGWGSERSGGSQLNYSMRECVDRNLSDPTIGQINAWADMEWVITDLGSWPADYPTGTVTVEDEWDNVYDKHKLSNVDHTFRITKVGPV